MSEIIGAVEVVDRKSGPEGKWKKLGVKVNDEWYSCFVNPENKAACDKVAEGDEVKILYDTNGQYKNIKTITLMPKASKGDKPATKAEYATPTQVANKDFKITLASARNAAIDFVDLLLRHEAIPVPAAKNKKADVMFEYVNKYTNVFAREILTTREEEVLFVEHIPEEGEEQIESTGKE